MKLIYLVILSFLCVPNAYTQQNNAQIVYSPDKNIAVTIDANQLFYNVKYKDKTVLKNSKLGILREDEDFTKDLKVVKSGQTKTIQDNYVMLNAKRKDITYTANQIKIETKSTSGKLMNIVFQVSNDGVAFRYEFPEKDKSIKKIKSESTSFHFVEGSKAWLQPKTNAQTGFEHTNPSYEAHYMMDIPVGTPSNSENGWVYPALFKTDNIWLMITEAGLENNYCGTALQQFSPNGEYKINFP